MSIRTAIHTRHWATAAACAGALLLAGCGTAAESASSTGSTTASSVTSSATSSSVASTSAADSTAPTEDKVTISDTWVKATVGAEDPTMTAAFGVMTNNTDQDLTIVSATNDVTDRTSCTRWQWLTGRW